MLGKSHKKSGRRLTPITWVFAFLVLVLLSISILLTAQIQRQTSTRILPRTVQQQITDLWASKSYQDLIDITTEKLEDDPLNSNLLFVRGAAVYYFAQEQINFTLQNDGYNQSIVDLRRALLVADESLLGQIHYILGKTYFNKGYYYYDLSYFHLLEAHNRGYHQSDSFEYLGLVNAELGNVLAGIEYLIASHEENPRAIILITIARLFASSEEYDQALEYALQAYDDSKDSFEQEQALLIAGSAYRVKEDWEGAREVYETLFTLNSNSADAKFYLGEVEAARGDYVQARVYWREAFGINPQHPGALSRLNS
ncbi:MAG: tetratricopeptide repeat protein [Spirochaetales bacterium]|nr:tetratricopeptide repeat protein [Spirochaetales bacterium]